MKAVPVGDHYAIYAVDFIGGAYRDRLVGVVRRHSNTDPDWVWAPIDPDDHPRATGRVHPNVEGALREAFMIRA